MERNLKSEVKKLCQLKGLTIVALAQKLNVPYATLNGMLSRNDIKTQLLPKMSALLGVAPDYFLSSESSDNLSDLSFFLNLRMELIQRLWNCPPALNDTMDYCISELYKVQQKVKQLMEEKSPATS